MQSTQPEKSLQEKVSNSEITVTVKRDSQTASAKMQVAEYQFLRQNHTVDPIEELVSQLIEELDRGI